VKAKTKCECVWLATVGVIVALAVHEFGLAASPTNISLDPRCTMMDWCPKAPLMRLANRSLLMLGENETLTSTDEGKTWNRNGPITDGEKPGVPSLASVLLRTRDGAIVLVYMDMSTAKEDWDGVRIEPRKSMRLDVWSIRSLDEGRSWIDRKKIFDGYCGALINIVETRDGHIIVPLEAFVADPGRHVTFTLVSADRGHTWTRSNMIDLGGHGHHDGALESNVAELMDGRMLLLVRTNLDRFWEAYSDDQGLSWRELRPSQLDASSSPGYLLRLASGRLALFWNRLYPEGKTSYTRYERPFTKRPASWHREELSLALSDDDGKSWTQPVVVARQKGGSVAYPYVFEHKPGELWVAVLWTLKSPEFCFRLKEEDFVGKRSAPRQAKAER